MLGIMLYTLILALLFLAGLHSLYTVYKNGIIASMAAEEVLKNPSDTSVKKYIQTIHNCELLNSGQLWSTLEKSCRKALAMPNISETLKEELKMLMTQKGIAAN